MVRYISILLSAIVILSCSRNQDGSFEEKSSYRPDSTAIKFNNKAISFMGSAAQVYDTTLKEALYDSALIYMNLAIKEDSLYLMAYTNKAQALQRKGALEEALSVLSKAQLLKPTHVESIMGQGLILEKMGKSTLANQKYKKALEAYKIRLEGSSDPAMVKSDIAFLYIFLESKFEALDEIKKVIDEYPNRQEPKAVKNYIENFDREEFIRSF